MKRYIFLGILTMTWAFSGMLSMDPIEFAKAPASAAARDIQQALGGRLPVARRAALVERARRDGFLVVEDDYDGELRYDVAPLPVLAAIARRERIAIHGDYDVDGVTSTVILRRALELLGADVVHFIPERLKDGYGLQPAAVERLHAEGVKLVVSVDCGIRGADAARRATELGVDLIVTDHHELPPELPPPDRKSVV